MAVSSVGVKWHSYIYFSRTVETHPVENLVCRLKFCRAYSVYSGSESSLLRFCQCCSMRLWECLGSFQLCCVCWSHAPPCWVMTVFGSACCPFLEETATSLLWLPTSCESNYLDPRKKPSLKLFWFSTILMCASELFRCLMGTCFLSGWSLWQTISYDGTVVSPLGSYCCAS